MVEIRGDGPRVDPHQYQTPKPAEQEQKPESRQELRALAEKLGLDLSSLPVDKVECSKFLMETARTLGLDAKNIGELAALVEEMEPKALQEVSAAYASAAEKIDADKLDPENLADEGDVRERPEGRGARGTGRGERSEGSRGADRAGETGDGGEVGDEIDAYNNVTQDPDDLDVLLNDEDGRRVLGEVTTELLDRSIDASNAQTLVASPQMQEIVAAIKAGDTEPTPEAVKEAVVGALPSGADNVDVNALVLAVLHEAYEGNLEDLRYEAEKLKAFNKLKEEMRDELTRARQALAATPQPTMNKESGAMSDPAVKDFKRKDFNTDITTDKEGRPSHNQATSGEKIGKRKALENYIQDLEGKLATVGDKSGLAQMNLQNMQQKQQQLLQTMSTTLKLDHDAKMAVIRNMA